MKPSSAILALETLTAIRQPAMLWGAPGVGKSAIIRQLCDRHNLQMIDVRATLLDPTDLRGLPSKGDNGSVQWLRPSFLPTSGAGVIFFDEINAAPQATQAACYQCILDFRLGDFPLPPNWVPMGAGNRESDRAVVSRMPSALANRFVHLDVETDLDDWSAWALGTDGANIEDVTPILPERPNLPISISSIAFARFRPALLHSFDPTRNDRAFPTPRTCEVADRIIQANPPQEILYDLLAGTCGEAWAAERLAFERIYKTLPSPDAIIMATDTAPVPTDPATIYATIGALTRKATAATVDALMIYANRLPAEFGMLMIRDMLRTQPQLASTRAYIAWATEHANILL